MIYPIAALLAMTLVWCCTFQRDCLHPVEALHKPGLAGFFFARNKILALKPHNWLLGLTNLQGNTKDAETEYAKLQSKPAGGFREPRFLGVEPCSENRTAFRFMCGARENHAE